MAGVYDSDGDGCAAALAAQRAEDAGPSVTLDGADAASISTALETTDALLRKLQGSKLPGYLRDPVHGVAVSVGTAWGHIRSAIAKASRQRGDADPAERSCAAALGQRPQRSAPHAAGSALLVGDAQPASRPEAASASDGATLEAAIIEIEKTVRDRARRYPDLVAKRRLKQETADHKLAAMRKAHDVLMFVERNEDWIKAEHARRARVRKEAADLQATHPDVHEVERHFPGAQIEDVRALSA